MDIIVTLKQLEDLGIEVFSTIEEYNNWLNTPNAFLDGDAPVNYTDTDTGRSIVKDMLTRIGYGYPL